MKAKNIRLLVKNGAAGRFLLRRGILFDKFHLEGGPPQFAVFRKAFTVEKPDFIEILLILLLRFVGEPNDF